MSKFQHDVMLRIVKILNVLMIELPFAACWFLYENWRFEDLPILPVEWKLLVHNTKKPQFNVLRKLLRSKKFDYVVNACDAG